VTTIDTPTTTISTETVLFSPNIGDTAEAAGRGIGGFFAAFHKEKLKRLKRENKQLSEDKENLERENKHLVANKEKAGKAAM